MSRKNKAYRVGIDYSMTSPCMTIVPEGGNWSDARAFFVTDKKVHAGQRAWNGATITGMPMSEWQTSMERFETLAALFVSLIEKLDDPNPAIWLEDYAMGAKGKVFHIAENTAILKYLLYKKGHRWATVPPTVLKKEATGKGNSDKNAMYAAFVAMHGAGLNELYGGKNTIKSPVSDIVDSYFLATKIQA